MFKYFPHAPPPNIASSPASNSSPPLSVFIQTSVVWQGGEDADEWSLSDLFHESGADPEFQRRGFDISTAEGGPL